MTDPKSFILSRSKQYAVPTAGPVDYRAVLRRRLLGIPEDHPEDATISAESDQIQPTTPQAAEEQGQLAGASSPAQAAAARAEQMMAAPAAPLETPAVDPVALVAPAPIAKDSGLSAEVSGKTTKNADRNRKLSMNFLYNPDDIKEAMNTFTGHPAYQAQEQGTQDLQDMLRASVETTTPQVDVSPTAALVDQWTGSKMADKYKAPATADEMKTRILNAQSKIQDDKRDLFKSLLASVNAQKGGGNYLTADALKYMQEQAAKDAAKDPAANEKKPTTPKNQFGQAYNAVMKNKSVIDLQNSINGLSKSRALLSVQNPQADSAFATNLLKAMGDTRISDRDKAEARRGMGGLGDKFDQLYQDLSTGTFNPKNRENYFIMLSALTNAQNKRLSGMTKMVNNIGDGFLLGDSQKKQLRQATIGDDEENAAAIRSSTKPGAPKAKAPSEMTPEQRKARIKELEAKAAAGKGK